LVSFIALEAIMERGRKSQCN